MQNTLTIKDRIISFIKLVGPSLPVRIAKDIKTSTLFTSAYLSELLSEKRLKASYLRVGNSPLYYIPGQESALERFANHLKSKEKDAFELLKDKRNIKDEEQEPAIRLALKSIKDFAIPFYVSGELYWRYFLEKEPGSKPVIERVIEPILDKEKVGTLTPLLKEVKKQIEKNEIEIIKEPSEEHQVNEIKLIKEEKPKKKIKKTIKKKTHKKDENLFNKVKDFLNRKEIEIIDIEDFNRDNLILKIKEKNKEKILIVYNKKKISEEDVIKANKKASEYSMDYSILSLGEPSKKLDKLIKAIKKLDSIDKLD